MMRCRHGLRRWPAHFGERSGRGRRDAARQELTAHQARLERIVDAAHEYADDNDLCARYDEFMMSVGLRPRSRDWVLRGGRHGASANHDGVRLVESISGMLGFTPVESLVLVLVRGGVLDCLMRADLAEAMRADGPERLADLVARNSADGVVAVVVSAEGASCPMCGSQFRALVGDVSAALKRRGGQLFDAVMVDGVEAGGRWSCIDNCGVAGVLDDPATSVMAAAAVVDGRRMFGTRDELKASVAVDADRVAALAPI